jgi:hypothetical protein
VVVEEKEDKGFVVRDRRRIVIEDTPPKEEPERTEAQGGTPPREDGRPEPGVGSEARSEATGAESKPFPEVTFSTFVFSLSSSALVHLGEIPDPSTNRLEQDLALAKQIIDTLGMLQEKTRGNLELDEDRLLKNVLYDLRLRYVQKRKG